MSSKKDKKGVIYQEMECPICLEYMTGDIYQCENSHNVCSSCKAKITVCPCCSLQVTMRNRGLENVAKKLSYPCMYSGCDAAYPLNDLEIHQMECPFGSFRCPVTCPFSGTLDDLLVHFMCKHNDILSHASSGLLVNTLLDAKPRSCWDQLIVYTGSVFFNSFVYTEDTFYGYVKHTGPVTGSKSYVYEISFLDVHGEATFTMKNEVQRCLVLEDDIFKSKKCLIMGKDVLQRYLDNRKRLKISTMLRCVGQHEKPDNSGKNKKLGAIPKIKPTQVPISFGADKPGLNGSEKYKTFPIPPPIQLVPGTFSTWFYTGPRVLNDKQNLGMRPKSGNTRQNSGCINMPLLGDRPESNDPKKDKKETKPKRNYNKRGSSGPVNSKGKPQA